MRALALLTLALLAACGADGAPEPRLGDSGLAPATGPQVDISGSVSMTFNRR